MIKVEVYTAGAFAQHPLLIWDDISKEAFLLDPGAFDASIEQKIEELNLKVKGIINTHAHLDHIGAVMHFKRKYNVELWMHPGEEMVLGYASESGRMFGVPDIEVPTIDHLIKEGDKLYLGEHEFIVIETPGHTPGGVCFYTPGHIFVGDTLFAGSIGRTDLPGGDYPTIMKSLEKFLHIPDETVVYSGHGPETTIGHEKKTNPYLSQVLDNTTV
jgi:glyoxylase-like metal-dependent hydrolase (beta-lactamase superfamily II)